MENLRRVGGSVDGVVTAPNERLLGPAFAHTSVGMGIADRSGRFIEANSAFLAIVGRTFEELSRETIESITHADDRDANAKHMRLLWNGEIPDFQLEKRYLRPDGVSVWVRNSVSVLRDRNGDPQYTIAISEDIDARKLAESKSAYAQETLEMATRAADLGTWDLNLLSGELQWSPRCRQIFGVGLEETITLDDFRNFLHPEDLPPVNTLIERVLDPGTKANYDTEYRVIRSSGEERWASATGKAWFEPVPGTTSGEERAIRFVGTIRDITERRRSTEALIQAEKLAATGRLAASIAHEINNPLEAVINLLFLLRHEDDRQQRLAYLALAEQEIKRVAEIATQTLRFYRDPAGPAAFDVQTILQSVLALLQGRMNLRNVRVSTRFAPGSHVFGSQGELRQVFLNFLTNALDAMPSGGRILLRARPSRNVQTGKPCVRVTFADTGEGMSPATVARIFEPFFTTRRSTGTGLGLWLSLEILNKHEATVRVRSKQGVGTVLCVMLPLAGQPSGA